MTPAPADTPAAPSFQSPAPLAAMPLCVASSNPNASMLHASCLDANCLDAYPILPADLAATLPSHECRITNAECRDPPRAVALTSRSHSMWKTPQHSTPRAHTSRNLHAPTTLVRAMHALGSFSSCITPHILRKCALVARHESPSSSVRFKRRQSASGVEGDKAADAPDDRANMDLAPTEPTTSGLGQLWGGPPVPGGRIPKALVDQATILRASEVSPSPPIPVRQPLTRFALWSKAGRSSHARGN